MESADAETPGQKAARLRREKRQAKAIGEDRLAKIKQLNGGVAPPEEVLGGPTTAPPAHQASVDDPDEVDIDHQSFGGQPLNANNGTANDPMLQAMLQMQAQARQGASPADPNAQNPGQGPQDQMTQMLQQLMGSASGNPNDPNSIHNTQDPMQMLSALMGNGGQSQPVDPVAQQAAARSAHLWRLTHAIFAITIAGYIAMTSTFDGSLLSRSQSIDDASIGFGSSPRLFWIFVSAELGLQTLRFFLDGGRLQGTGMLATISNMAPEPWAAYVRTAGRWSSILGSIISDAMVVVFVFGVLAWWRGSPQSVR